MTTTIKGANYKTGDSIEVQIVDNLISQIVGHPSENSSQIIAPGLVDLQVNGFKGIDLNSGELTEDEVIQITQFLWEEGVTAFLPTLITNSSAKIESAIDAIVQACDKKVLVGKSILGIHLEGPFLSKEDGPRGAHPMEHIQNPDWQLFSEWQERSGNRIKKITLAPELPGAVEFIGRCAEVGVLVSLGHTAASPEKIQEAVKAGAKMSTHLGNAAHLSLPRHPNYIWEQLASDELWISLIADGFHLPESVIKVFTKVKPNTSILVSDSTKFAGLSAGTYSSHIGGDIELSTEGRLFMKRSPELLAGSAQSLLGCVNHMMKSDLANLPTAIDMASLKPMELMSGTLQKLNSKSPTDIVVFEKGKSGLSVIKTFKSGQLVFTR
ncbi:N-acetylglucosamine-6-phosphate deacetylase [Pseudozobellia sp. WGM2]|uniref:N-acetylglucosamine-6-phosphate deacetylase n=1 Tax=Pseudozobellia sp. WGM2 TaxID=2787625 RepID=UPI001AE08A4C|nr:amidohydrolase family protein [Pseudozobellia sp. WGM2]